MLVNPGGAPSVTQGFAAAAAAAAAVFAAAPAASRVLAPWTT
jgi:hypothetical protein